MQEHMLTQAGVARHSRTGSNASNARHVCVLSSIDHLLSGRSVRGGRGSPEGSIVPTQLRTEWADHPTPLQRFMDLLYEWSCDPHASSSVNLHERRPPLHGPSWCEGLTECRREMHDPCFSTVSHPRVSWKAQICIALRAAGIRA